MDYIALAQKHRDDVNQLFNDTETWQKSKENDRILIESKPSPCFDGNVYRTVSNVNAPMEEVFKALDPAPGSIRVSWDKDVKSIDLIRDISPEIRLQVWTTNSIAKGLISSRDMTHMTYTTKTDDVIFTSGASVDLDDYPPTNKCVRAFAHPFAIKVEKNHAVPGTCKVSIIIQTELRGKIPSSVREASIPKLLAGSIDGLHGYLKKNDLFSTDNGTEV